MTESKKCPACRGTGQGIDPVFGHAGKCYPCDASGRDHREKPDHTKHCWICWRYQAFNIPVLNKKHDTIPKGAVYVGRPTIFGNPFKIGRDGDRKEVVDLFEAYFEAEIEKDEKFRERVEGLTDVPALVCWCAPDRCHADVISDWIRRNTWR